MATPAKNHVILDALVARSHRSKHEELKLGDVVLVEEQFKPRLKWKMGQVSEVRHGRDDRVRSCELTLAGGGVLRRPIQRLVQLEVEALPGLSSNQEKHPVGTPINTLQPGIKF
uniref:DUF5641 domain-containing protein n=1 Tax=Strigamia maritima TaxID=126957 RepID=T1IJY7_STRMM